MKKLVFRIALLSLVVTGFTSCEADSLDEQAELELQLVDPDDDGTIEDEDRPRD